MDRKSHQLNKCSTFIDPPLSDLVRFGPIWSIVKLSCRAGLLINNADVFIDWKTLLLIDQTFVDRKLIPNDHVWKAAPGPMLVP